MLIDIKLTYVEQPITLINVPKFASLSTPFEETTRYEPLFSFPKRNAQWLSEHFTDSVLIGLVDDSKEKLFYFHQVGKSSFFFYVRSQKYVRYCIRCELVDIPSIGKAVCQTSLWRHADYFSGVSMPSWVFFNVLLPKYKMILSDQSQSRDGKAFWIRRMAEALRQNLFVYIVDTRDSKADITRIESGQEFDRNFARKLWSTTNHAFCNVRLLISSAKL